jgi:hypothetical protein
MAVIRPKSNGVRGDPERTGGRGMRVGAVLANLFERKPARGRKGGDGGASRFLKRLR